MRRTFPFLCSILIARKAVSGFVSPSTCCHPPAVRLRAQSNSFDDERELAIMEKEVKESTAAKLDRRRVANALFEEAPRADPTQTTPTWKIAASAGVVFSGLSFFVMHSWILSIVTFTAVFLSANGDPYEEESIAGALARIVGRATLQSYEQSEPKIKAVARAAIKPAKDNFAMNDEMEMLRKENAELKLWKERRTWVDQHSSMFTLEDLKEKARKNGLRIGGSKSEILMRLLEARVIDFYR